MMLAAFAGWCASEEYRLDGDLRRGRSAAHMEADSSQSFDG
jgi:hypothetical protein